MDSNTLYISEDLCTSLVAYQLDAIELACLDCSYMAYTSENILEITETLQQNKNNLLLCSFYFYIKLKEVFDKDLSEQIILILTEKETCLTGIESKIINGIHYLIGGLSSPDVVRASLATILENKIFPNLRGLLPRLMKIESATMDKKILKHSSERNLFQEYVVDFFKNDQEHRKEKFVAGTSIFPKNLGAILDELLMNAIWDANINRRDVDRTKTIELNELEYIEVECFSDGTTLALSVIDKHGTFPLSAIFRPIKHILGFKEEIVVNNGLGGAGIGLYMILQKISILTVEVHKNKLCRVTAFLRADLSLKETQRRPKTILYFEQN